jgi:ATP synthase protein I
MFLLRFDVSMIKKVSSRGFAFDGRGALSSARDDCRGKTSSSSRTVVGRRSGGDDGPQSGGERAMAKAVILQAVMTSIVAAIAAMIGGRNAALSALVGGVACLVPNALFALRLFADSRRPGGATVHGFFIGEFAKLAATIVILFVAARVYRGLDWLALIVSLIAVSHSYILTFALRRRRG